MMTRTRSRAKQQISCRHSCRHTQGLCNHPPMHAHTSLGQHGTWRVSGTVSASHCSQSQCSLRHKLTLYIATNSATRVRRFEHLSGSALAHAISPLPEWEQLHELNFLFNDFDVLVTYIVDIEGFTVVAKHNNTPDAIMRAMISHGFHVSLVVKSRSFARYRNVKSALSKTMDDLFATTPSPTPTSMLPGEFILRMPGHTGELIVLSDQDTFKGNNFQVGNYKEVPEMCPKAAMEIYNDVHAREHLITLWWSRLRILDPILRPWRRGEKMTDVNLQVLDPNHPVHKCMPPFWSLKFQN